MKDGMFVVHKIFKMGIHMACYLIITNATIHMIEYCIIEILNKKENGV